MKKAELIATVAEETGMSQVATKAIIDCLLKTIIQTAKKDKRLALYGLGVFRVVKRAKRTCRNPQTGEEIKVKAYNSLSFRPARSIKALLS
ncbi:MAG: HU family DNA-binding protein [Deltaproteobacteria bacterium]|jgi:DNA-binding protein HU-beta|nr:HU family DNA-binding protein [Deltaproteobacteria bacterium]